jgi:O-antigen/teichoic acid export membrane protein
VLTQFLQPAAYGVLSLSLGISVLAIGLISTPTTQAAIHYYPGIVADGGVGELLSALLRCFRSTVPWVALAVVLGGLWFVESANGSALLVLLLTLLIASDCWRSVNLSLLNAARRQRRYALWAAADAWGRPLAGTAVALTVGQSPVAVLASYVLVSATLLLIFSRQLWPDRQHADAVYPESRRRELDSRIWTYALPLVPLGVIAWASSLGDRYIIGGLLNAGEAGVYVAVYGLASIPFMIVVGTAEQALRPVYQAAVSNADRARSRRILSIWLGVVVLCCSVGVLFFAFGNELIAKLFVGKPYRYAAPLMTWIGIGYAIRATSYVFERVCYAYGQTRRVLAIQLCAVVAAAIVTPLGVVTLGIRGAAMAVPVYFSVQLAVALFQARQTLRAAQANAADIDGAVPAGP